MSAPTVVHPARAVLGFGWGREGHLAHGVDQGGEVIVARSAHRARIEPDDLPAAGAGEAKRVRGTQVVAVGFRVGRERAKHRGGVGVDIGQGGNGRATTRGSGATSTGAHEGRPYPPAGQDRGIAPGGSRIGVI